jgi:hypothetical protein
MESSFFKRAVSWSRIHSALTSPFSFSFYLYFVGAEELLSLWQLINYLVLT